MPASAPAAKTRFGEKLLSAMRKEFGGHIESTIPVHKAKDEDQ